MAGETVITIVGNLTSDPELRYTQTGIAVANFTIASTARSFDKQSNQWKDGDELFLRSSIWREYATQVASSLRKGNRVIAQGRLRQTKWQDDKSGETRYGMEFQVDEIGPALRYATAEVTRVQKDGGAPSGMGQQQGGYAPPAQQADPWNNPGAQQQGGTASQGDAWSQPGVYGEEPF